MVDMGILAGFGRALKGQGRLGDVDAWRGRSGGIIAITGGVAVVGGAFLMGDLGGGDGCG